MTRKQALSIFLPLLLVLVTAGVPVLKQDVLVELFYNAAWHDHTADVYTRDQIVINHGAGNEQTGVVPSDASLTFDNRDGEMNPEQQAVVSVRVDWTQHPHPHQRGQRHPLLRPSRVLETPPCRWCTLPTRGDAWVHVQAQGTIRRRGAGPPPKESALTRYIRDSDPLVWWPLESGDGRKVTSTPSGLTGGTPMTATPASGETPLASGVVGGSTVGPFGAAAAIDLTELSADGQLSGKVPASSATAPFRYEMGILIREQIAVLGATILFQIQFGTSLVTVTATEEAGEETSILFEGVDTFHPDVAATTLDDGVWHHVRLDLSTPRRRCQY